MKTQWVIKFFFAVTIITLVTIIGCKQDESKSSKAGKPKPVLVQAVKVTPHPLETTVELVGTIEPKISAKIIAPSDGVIEKLYVKENDFVRSNQVVGVISSADRIALLGETQARIEQLENLLKTKKDSMDSESIQAELRRAKEDYEQAQRLFLGTPVVSPINGYIIEKPIEVGTIVSAKQPLLTVADLSNLIIRTAISELLLSKIYIGQKLQVRIDAFPEQPFTGVITLISPQVNPSTRTADIEIRVFNANNKLKPGMLAVATIVTDRREHALAIPSDAILNRADGENIVFIVKDSTAYQRNIKTGIHTKTEIEITEGIQAGDQVVIFGQELLKDGIPVKIQPQKGAVKVANDKKELTK